MWLYCFRYLKGTYFLCLLSFVFPRVANCLICLCVWIPTELTWCMSAGCVLLSCQQNLYQAPVFPKPHCKAAAPTLNTMK